MKTLVEELEQCRCERPGEFVMDRFIMLAKQLEPDNTPLTVEEDEFMRDCNLYPQSFGDAKIMTENDEGSHLDNSDLLKLSDIIRRYAINYNK